MHIRTMFAVINDDQSVSVLDATFQRVASWPKDYAGRPKRHHNQVLLNNHKCFISWIN